MFAHFTLYLFHWTGEKSRVNDNIFCHVPYKTIFSGSTALAIWWIKSRNYAKKPSDYQTSCLLKLRRKTLSFVAVQSLFDDWLYYVLYRKNVLCVLCNVSRVHWMKIISWSKLLQPTFLQMCSFRLPSVSCLLSTALLLLLLLHSW